MTLKWTALYSPHGALNLSLFLSCNTASTPHVGFCRRGSRALAAPIVYQDDFSIVGKSLPHATGSRDLRERWPRYDALLASGVAALAQENEAQDALRPVFVSGRSRVQESQTPRC